MFTENLKTYWLLQNQSTMFLTLYDKYMNVPAKHPISTRNKYRIFSNLICTLFTVSEG